MPKKVKTGRLLLGYVIIIIVDLIIDYLASRSLARRLHRLKTDAWEENKSQKSTLMDVFQASSLKIDTDLDRKNSMNVQQPPTTRSMIINSVNAADDSEISNIGTFGTRKEAAPTFARTFPILSRRSYEDTGLRSMGINMFGENVARCYLYVAALAAVVESVSLIVPSVNEVEQH